MTVKKTSHLHNGFKVKVEFILSSARETYDVLPLFKGQDRMRRGHRETKEEM